MHIPFHRKALAMAALLSAVACAATFAAAREQLPTPPGFEDDEVDIDEHVLTIPGVGRFPLPPGARALRPQAAPKAAPTRPPQEARKPDAPPPTPAQRVTELVAALAQAKDDGEALRIATVLQRFWAVSGSDTIDLLSARAAQAASMGAAPLARELLDSVVLLRPAFAEGFVRRAHVRHALDDLTGATQDLEMALRLEPRRFDVMAMLGSAAEEAGDKRRALDLYRQSLALDPQQSALKEREERLRLDVEGRDL